MFHVSCCNALDLVNKHSSSKGDAGDDTDLEIHEILNLLQPEPLPLPERTYSRQSYDYSSSDSNAIIEEENIDYDEDDVFNGANQILDQFNDIFNIPQNIPQNNEANQDENQQNDENCSEPEWYEYMENYQYNSSLTDEFDSDDSLAPVSYKSEVDDKWPNWRNLSYRKTMSYAPGVKSGEMPSYFYCRDVKQSFQSLFENKLFTDVVIVSGGKKFHCHKFLLSSLSGYFRAIFTVGMKETFQKEIVIHEPPAVVKLMLRFMYSGMYCHCLTDPCLL